MSLQINQKKEAFLASDDLFRPSGFAVPVAGVSPIPNNIHQAHHLPAMQQHPGRARAERICVNLRHYLHQCVPAPVFSACNLVRSPGQNAGVITPENYAPLENGPQSRLHNFRVGAAGPINLRPDFSPIGTALTRGSGNPSTDGENVNVAVPFFDLFTTIYAAVIRSVSAYGNSDEKDSLYDSAETFAPRFGFNGLKKAAAQLLTDAVSTQASIRTYSHNSQESETASVFSYLIPTNQGTAATNPLNSATGGTELQLFPQQGQHDDTYYCAVVRAAGLAAGAYRWCKSLRPHFLNNPLLALINLFRRMSNATGIRGGFSPGSFLCEIASLRSSLRTEATPFFRHTTQKNIRHVTSRASPRLF